MGTSIAIKHKKRFIKWFLNNYSVKKIEATWILNYLVSHDKLLNNVSFVNDAKFCPRAMIITSTCADGIPFLYYKQHVVTDDTDKFFHDIRLNQDEKIYIQINYKKANQCPNYAKVLEENPFKPINKHQLEQDKYVSQYILKQLLMKQLKNEIDQALDEKNEAKFNKLVLELRKLETNNALK